MMSNPRFYSLGGRAGWEESRRLNLTVTGDPPTIRLSALPGPPSPIGTGAFGGLTPPASVAVGADDLIYLLDAGEGLVRRLDPCTETFETLPCVGGHGRDPRQVVDPEAIAVSVRGDLWIADTGNRRLQVFALKGLALRALIGPLKVESNALGVSVKPAHCLDAGATEEHWPSGTWKPTDVALDMRGWAYVCDSANGLIHVFDAGFRWQAAWDGAHGDSRLERPSRLAIDACGCLYIIQEGKATIYVLERDGSFANELQGPDELKDRLDPTAVAIDERGILHIHDRARDRIHVFCQANGGAFSWVGAVSAATGSDFLTFDRHGNAVQVDKKRRQLVALAAGARFQTEGLFVTEPLDSGQYRCQWDRIRIVADVPDGTDVTVETLTAETAKTAAEIAALNNGWATHQTITVADKGDWDCMILSAPGRYLWLRLTLASGGLATPAVSLAEVFYPRKTSIQYLPSVYREDPEGSDFTARFLSIFDAVRDTIVDRFDDFASNLDAGSSPAASKAGTNLDFLSWLALWIGLTLDRHWPIEKRRRLLDNAATLYALRGTLEGLRMHLRLYLDSDPQILEHYRLRRWMFVGQGRLGDCSAIWGPEVMQRLQLDVYSRVGEVMVDAPGDPVHDPFRAFAHKFTIFMPAIGSDDATQQQTVERVIAMAKPAHTQHFIQYVEPRFRIGIQALVGIDTYVARYPSSTPEGEARLGDDAVLGPSPDESTPPSMRIGSHTRIGSTTVID